MRTFISAAIAALFLFIVPSHAERYLLQDNLQGLLLPEDRSDKFSTREILPDQMCYLENGGVLDTVVESSSSDKPKTDVITRDLYVRASYRPPYARKRGDNCPRGPVWLPRKWLGNPHNMRELR